MPIFHFATRSSDTSIKEIPTDGWLTSVGRLATTTTTLNPIEINHNHTRYITQVQSGEYHIIFQLSDGCLYAYGQADHGRLGVGKIISNEIHIPMQIDFGNNSIVNTGDITTTAISSASISASLLPLPRIVQFSCGGYHSVFLDDEGHVYTCGRTNEGACGFKIYERHFVTNSEPLYTPRKWTLKEHAGVYGKVKKVQAGGHQTIVLTIDGQVWTCGQNTYTQCGRELGTDNLFTPDRVMFPGDRNGQQSIFIDDISSSYYHTVCLMNTGSNNLSSTTEVLKHQRQRIFIFGDFTGASKTNLPIEICLPNAYIHHTIHQVSCGVHCSCFVMDNGRSLTLTRTRMASGGVILTDQEQQTSLPEQIQIVQSNSTSKAVDSTFFPSFSMEESSIPYVSCGYYHSTVLTTDGRVVFYGNNISLPRDIVPHQQQQQNQQQKRTRVEYVPPLIVGHGPMRFGLVASGHMKTVAISKDLVSCQARTKIFGLSVFFMESQMRLVSMVARGTSTFSRDLFFDLLVVCR